MANSVNALVHQWVQRVQYYHAMDHEWAKKSMLHSVSDSRSTTLCHCARCTPYNIVQNVHNLSWVQVPQLLEIYTKLTCVNISLGPAHWGQHSILLMWV